MVLFVDDTLVGDRGVRNDEFARWPVQGIWECVSDVAFADVDGLE
jgi:hypothetical protein